MNEAISLKGCIHMNPTIYAEADYTAIQQQKKKRWYLLLIPCAILLALMIYSLVIRLEWLTVSTTIVIGVLLIAGYDFAIKPLRCYQKHLPNCLHGRTRECELAFIRLSENVDVVEGVSCRQLLLADEDAKGRPYERLFYFDAQKEFPAAKPGDMMHVVHHDLFVANIYQA